jgi:hypothetical protein
MTEPSIFNGQRFSDRDLIESILNQFFIVDYGFVTTVNADKTVNVTHATKPLTTEGESLPAITSKNIQVLTYSNANISLNFPISKDDKVLLLGLKNLVEDVSGVKTAEEQKTRIHYARETLKALPLCLFNSDSKIKITAENGKMSINTNDVLELNGNDNGGVVIAPELKTQLGYLTQRVDTIINALKNSTTAAQDGGATYKAGIVTMLSTIVNKEDFSNIESDKVKHGKGGN